MIGQGDTLLIATRNAGKTKEFAEAFGALGITVMDLREVDSIPEIEETGVTFAENALIKAKTVADLTGLPVLADDSGLCVDALGGDPGVYSARYAGAGAKDADNNAKLLSELAALPELPVVEAEGPQGKKLLSSARFVASLVLYEPSTGEKTTAEGAVEGYIMDSASGEGGFGYDPLFYVPEFGLSMAEMSVARKNEISHRGKALRLLLEKLR
ncbi:RdgB/HAM1 family non-canonical purine NTP pyrophosphatase [Cohnella thailandensis]|uniref:dITP/XTP pyrophosphatase n=1 Tax=Cohnella thailandensis TaxID=557557 RepID=A0A841SPH9_9BACL|nr:RdgB/HAM1 family non-canonical purine NTP pyrophosphatase [Cohnella thailandensis]MBB6633864.1 RdgB/HAM1 family non-canonical purine NTP pyrophosphatase [Cohnella thailandensis]MBP1972547.1 XTP/dITP diphosphohydrolase [Cohnella thailandensis]